jgi:hypothetical protein
LIAGRTERGPFAPRRNASFGTAHKSASRNRIEEGIAMLKVIVLALGLAVIFFSQTKLPPEWAATCVNSECIVGP